MEVCGKLLFPQSIQDKSGNCKTGVNEYKWSKCNIYRHSLLLNTVCNDLTPLYPAAKFTPFFVAQLRF